MVLPLFVARLSDSRLRLPRFSQGSPKVLPSGSPSLGGTSARFSAKVAKVLPRFSQVVLPLLVARLLDSRLKLPSFSEGSPKWFSLSWWHVCWILAYGCQGSPKVLPSGSPCLGDTCAGLSAKVAKVLLRFSSDSPKWFSLSSWHVCQILG